ncbi:hypothetical protein TNCV_4046601 [Trichonephila clavipes]|nr:hypothetical protein TNCV_4046601 [Trichonephila clavipes]
MVNFRPWNNPFENFLSALLYPRHARLERYLAIWLVKEVFDKLNSNLGHHTGQANAMRGINADQIRCSQLASLDKNNALREIKLRLSYLQGKSTTMSVIAHQTEKEWISANEKSRQRMSQTQAEGAAKQHAARLEETHLLAHHSCFTTSERC